MTTKLHNEEIQTFALNDLEVNGVDSAPAVMGSLFSSRANQPKEGQAGLSKKTIDIAGQVHQVTQDSSHPAERKVAVASSHLKRSSTIPPAMLPDDKAEMLQEQRYELISRALTFAKDTTRSIPPEKLSQIYSALEAASLRADFLDCFRVILDDGNTKIWRSAVDIHEFITAVAKKGPKAGEALQDAEVIYTCNKQTYDRMVELAQTRGGPNVKALTMGWPIYSKNSRIFATFLQVASKGSKEDIVALVETSLALYPPAQGPADADQIRRVVSLISEHGAEIGEVIIDAKRISSESEKEAKRTNGQPKPRDEIMDLFFTLMDQKGIEAGKTLINAARHYQSDITKMRIIADLIIRSGTTSAEVFFAAKDLYEDDLEKIKKMAQITAKHGPAGCCAAMAIHPLWEVSDDAFYKSINILLDADHATVQAVANMDDRIVLFMSEFIGKIVAKTTKTT